MKTVQVSEKFNAKINCIASQLSMMAKTYNIFWFCFELDEDEALRNTNNLMNGIHKPNPVNGAASSSNDEYDK